MVKLQLLHPLVVIHQLLLHPRFGELLAGRCLLATGPRLQTI